MRTAFTALGATLGATLGASVAMALAAGPALAQTITLVGLNAEQTKTLTLADVDALPQVKLTLQQRGKTRVFEGVPLLELMREVKGPWGDTLTGKQMDEVLLVSCADGYKVAYSVGEADPGTAKGQILLVNKVDGAPLDAKAGPFETVVENDLRPARTAHQVETVRLLKLQ